jgi:hypothetical protein
VITAAGQFASLLITSTGFSSSEVGAQWISSRLPAGRVFVFNFSWSKKKKLFFASRVVFALDSSPPAPSSMYPSSLAYLYLVKCLVSRDCYDYPPEIVMTLHLMPTVSGAPLRWIRGSNVPVLLDCTDSTQGSAGSVTLT